jgi:hypothetical protein
MFAWLFFVREWKNVLSLLRRAIQKNGCALLDFTQTLLGTLAINNAAIHASVRISREIAGCYAVFGWTAFRSPSASPFCALAGSWIQRAVRAGSEATDRRNRAGDEIANREKLANELQRRNEREEQARPVLTKLTTYGNV